MRVRCEWSGQEIMIAFLKQVVAKRWWGPRKEVTVTNVHVECSNCKQHQNIEQLVVFIDVEVK